MYLWLLRHSTIGIQTSMKLVQQTIPSVAELANGRREFLRGTAAAAAGIGVLMALTDGEAQADGSGDIQILLAAQIAEALAVTTYTNIIATSPFFTRIPVDEQGYLIAARQEEMSHYNLEKIGDKSRQPVHKIFLSSNHVHERAGYVEHACDA
jgi:hypothetical protein